MFFSIFLVTTCALGGRYIWNGAFVFSAIFYKYEFPWQTGVFTIFFFCLNPTFIRCNINNSAIGGLKTF